MKCKVCGKDKSFWDGTVAISGFICKGCGENAAAKKGVESNQGFGEALASAVRPYRSDDCSLIEILADTKGQFYIVLKRSDGGQWRIPLSSKQLQFFTRHAKGSEPGKTGMPVIDILNLMVKEVGFPGAPVNDCPQPPGMVVNLRDAAGNSHEVKLTAEQSAQFDAMKQAGLSEPIAFSRILTPAQMNELGTSRVMMERQSNTSPELQAMKKEFFGHLQAGRYAEALTAVDHAIRFADKDPDLWRSRADILVALGRNGESIEAFRVAFQCGEQDSASWQCEVLTSLSVAFEAVGQAEDAIPCSDEAIRLDAKNAHAWLNRANALNAVARYEEALTNIDRAIELKLNHPYVAPLNRARALWGLGRWAEAIVESNLVIASQDIAPAHMANAHWYRGEALHNLNRFPEAVCSYDKSAVIYSGAPRLRKLRDEAIRGIRPSSSPPSPIGSPVSRGPAVVSDGSAAAKNARKAMSEPRVGK